MPLLKPPMRAARKPPMSLPNPGWRRPLPTRWAGRFRPQLNNPTLFPLQSINTGDRVPMGVDVITGINVQLVKLMVGRPHEYAQMVSEYQPLPVGTYALSFRNGSLSSIGTSVLQLVAGPVLAFQGVMIRADKANTQTVYVGGSNVTAGSAAATDGMPLYAGDAAVFPVYDAGILYLIAGGSGQKVYWWAL